MTTNSTPLCYHTGQSVRVGAYQLWAGGYYLSSACVEGIDLLVALGGQLPVEFGTVCSLPVLWMPLRDFGGVPRDWEAILRAEVIPRLADGKRLAVFCHAGHGRTGCLLASLVALLESVRDPIAAVRARYCPAAVETRAQAEAVFALLGRPLPRKYQQAFAPATGKVGQK